jgi:hypothetical protein
MTYAYPLTPIRHLQFVQAGFPAAVSAADVVACRNAETDEHMRRDI